MCAEIASAIITTSGTLKILDFGLARLMTSELTGSNMMMGTLNYMSPEQVRGERTDHRADIFSFGVVLYEALSGRRPFAGTSDVSVVRAIVHRDAGPLPGVDALFAAHSAMFGRRGDDLGRRLGRLVDVRAGQIELDRHVGQLGAGQGVFGGAESAHRDPDREPARLRLARPPSAG